MAIKLDMERVYKKMRWDYLEVAMKKFGICDK